VQWPVPRRDRPAPSPPRRHYLRVSADAHPGLVRRVDSLVRRAGLTVQNRATRAEPLITHHGFVISPSDDAQLRDVVDQIRELGRVENTLWLGVVE
jgi:acetolactate synthase regulatory subunit